MFHLPVSFRKRPGRGLLLSFLGAISMAVASPLAQAAVLFGENFGSAVEEQVWSAYPGWSATETVADPAIIKTAHERKMGTFAYNATTLTTTFAQPYSLATQGYRLSFQISGPVNRGLVVLLGDANNDRLGMEVGYTGSLYGIGGTYVTQFQGYGQRSHYNPDTGYGGYYSATTAPSSFSSTALYHATIDINGTSSALEIGGTLLDAGKIRITFNDGNVGGMATYTILFDIPATFDGLNTLQIGKTASGGAVWSIGDFELTSYAVVPEPSSLAAFLAGGLLLGLRFRRRLV